MRTIIEAASCYQVGYVGEYFINTGLKIGQLQLSHSRRVKQPPAGAKLVHLSMRRCMSAFGVVFTNVLRLDPVSGQKRIDQGRLSDAG